MLVDDHLPLTLLSESPRSGTGAKTPESFHTCQDCCGGFATALNLARPLPRPLPVQPLAPCSFLLSARILLAPAHSGPVKLERRGAVWHLVSLLRLSLRPHGYALRADRKGAAQQRMIGTAWLSVG